VVGTRGEPQNIEHRIMNAEGDQRSDCTSLFEIPCSTFDIQFVRGRHLAP
jgi:hypothetical protein